MWKPIKEIDLDRLKINQKVKFSETKKGTVSEIKKNSDVVIRWDSGRYAWPISFKALQNDDYHVWQEK